MCECLHEKLSSHIYTLIIENSETLIGSGGKRLIILCHQVVLKCVSKCFTARNISTQMTATGINQNTPMVSCLILIKYIDEASIHSRTLSVLTVISQA